MRIEEKFRRIHQDDPEDVRTFIAFLRLLRGWTQADLADALGLTAGAISRYETGDVVPDRETLEEVALAVGLPLSMLDRVFLAVAAARSAVASASRSERSGPAFRRPHPRPGRGALRPRLPRHGHGARRAAGPGRRSLGKVLADSRA